MSMKIRACVLAAVAAMFGLQAQGVTETWNLPGNFVTVTETGIVDGDMGNGGAVQVDMNTFDEAEALSLEGVACTLTKVVIAINGSLAYSIEVDSENPTGADFDVGIYGDGAIFSHSTYSATEGYSGSSTLSLAADDEPGTADFAGPDYGKWAGTNPGEDDGLLEITDNLSYFTKAVSGDTLEWDVNYKLTLGVSGPNAAYRTSGTGTADISITYFYEPVPEPATWALIGVGGLVLVLRRRMVRKG
jgi:hypothetical protein